jgi:hypothetical protein
MSENITKLRELTEKLSIKDKELLESEQMLRTMMENLPGSINIWITDLDLKLKCLSGDSIKSDRACKSGKKTIFDYIDKKKDLTLIKAHEDAIKGVASKFEYEFSGTNYLFSIKPLEDKFGKIVGTIGTQFNISKYISIKNKLNEIISLLKVCEEFNNLTCEESEKIKQLIYSE